MIVLCPDPRPISRLGHAGRPISALVSTCSAGERRHCRRSCCRAGACEPLPAACALRAARWRHAKRERLLGAEQHAEQSRAARRGAHGASRRHSARSWWSLATHEVAALALAQDDGSACMKAAQILGVLADYNPSELTFQLTKLAKPICMHRFEVLKWLADCPLSKRPPAIHWAHGR